MNKLERAAMQQALDALEEYRDTQMIKAPRRAITALREALAEQAEQEPVLKRRIGDCLLCGHCADTGKRIYAAPVRTKDLTCQEVTALIMEGAASGGWQGFAERIQKAFKEKNK